MVYEKCIIISIMVSALKMFFPCAWFSPLAGFFFYYTLSVLSSMFSQKSCIITFPTSSIHWVDKDGWMDEYDGTGLG